jgi:hypothetical protein
MMARADKPTEFQEQLRSLINCNCAENGSDTPDFILAKYMDACLTAFEEATAARDKWYGRKGLSEGNAAPVGLAEDPHTGRLLP